MHSHQLLSIALGLAPPPQFQSTMPFQMVSIAKRPTYLQIYVCSNIKTLFITYIALTQVFAESLIFPRVPGDMCHYCS